MEFICRILEFGSEEQLKSIELRREILRKPLDLDFKEDELKKEDGQIHIGCYSGKQLVGILLLKQVIQSGMQMRQVAVAADIQGKGVGKIMVRFSERWMKDNGVSFVILHARKTAVPFYLQQDYKVISDEFLEVGIPHFEMRKEL